MATVTNPADASWNGSRAPNSLWIDGGSNHTKVRRLWFADGCRHQICGIQVQMLRPIQACVAMQKSLHSHLRQFWDNSALLFEQIAVYWIDAY